MSSTKTQKALAFCPNDILAIGVETSPVKNADARVVVDLNVDDYDYPSTFADVVTAVFAAFAARMSGLTEEAVEDLHEKVDKLENKLHTARIDVADYKVNAERSASQRDQLRRDIAQLRTEHNARKVALAALQAQYDEAMSYLSDEEKEAVSCNLIVSITGRLERKNGFNLVVNDEGTTVNKIALIKATRVGFDGDLKATKVAWDEALRGMSHEEDETVTFGTFPAGFGRQIVRDLMDLGLDVSVTRVDTEVDEIDPMDRLNFR